MSNYPYRHIDPRILFDTMDGDAESFRSLSATYLESAPLLFSKLTEAIARRDTKAICLQSHSLKGTVFLIGAKELTHLLQKIETDSRHGEKDDFRDFLPELQTLFDNVIAEVKISIDQFPHINDKI